MCRKVSGAPFTGFVEFPDGALERTQGRPEEFHSSEGVLRCFCGACGSSLTFEADGIVFVSLGSLDSPERIVVKDHTYTSSQLLGIKLADGLPQFPGPAGGKGGRPMERPPIIDNGAKELRPALGVLPRPARLLPTSTTLPSLPVHRQTEARHRRVRLYVGLTQNGRNKFTPAVTRLYRSGTAGLWRLHEVGVSFP